jgi:hypothetical protein
MPRSLRSSLGLTTAAAFAAFSLFAAAPGDAHAQSCGMGEVDWYQTERANVATAETLLHEGETQRAAALLQKTWPRLREAVPVNGSLSVILDGVRLMALAAVRSDGDVPSTLGWSSRTPEERASNVAWGIKRLRMLATVNQTDVLVQANLGEALARSHSTRDEARTILEWLASGDRLYTSEAFAALALVRSTAGDAVGADAAGMECARRAQDFAIECAAIGGRVPPSETPAVTAAR